MSDARRRLPRSLTVSGLILSLALVAAACSGAGTPSASSAPGASSEATAASSAAPAGSVCDDLAALQASISALGDVDLKAGGTDALTAAVGDVKTSAEALKASASTELASAVDTFSTQLYALQAAAAKLGSGDGSGLVAVGTAISGLATSAQSLEAEFKSACP